MQLEGTSAIVAGGASGLGEATVRLLHERGALVTIADVNAEKGGALASELGLEFVSCDVREEEQVQAAVERAAADEGLRIAVCCAGTGWAQKVAGSKGPHPLLPFERVFTQLNRARQVHETRAAVCLTPPHTRIERMEIPQQFHLFFLIECFHGGFDFGERAHGGKIAPHSFRWQGTDAIPSPRSTASPAVRVPKPSARERGGNTSLQIGASPYALSHQATNGFSSCSAAYYQYVQHTRSVVAPATAAFLCLRTAKHASYQ